MKKLFIAALFAVTFITSAFAAETKVSSAIRSAFQVDFKNATDINWTAGDSFVKATFVINNERMEAFYSPQGEMIGTSKAITVDQLSAKAKKAFANKFGSYNVTEAIRFEGMEESAYFIKAENEKEKVIVKINDADQMPMVSTSKK